MQGKPLEIMDTTLRDGEQTSGIAFTAGEKLNIAKLLLEEIKVDRIEIASARVSEGEMEGSKGITKWAKSHGYLDRVEILCFIDTPHSLNWVNEAGGKVANLLTKGSLKHVQGQLKKTPEEHLKDIIEAVSYANKLGISTNIYLETWSNGMIDSRDYVFFLMDGLKNSGIKRFMLPDTLGILNPDNTYEYCSIMRKKYPGIHFDFHAHNDYDFATANTFAAAKAGIDGVHTTVNGLGERAGNVALSSVIATLIDHAHCKLNVDESRIYKVSQFVETFSGIRIPANKPVIGENVFTQTSGVHADGDNKDNLYFNDLLPERFGRIRKYALGKTSGKANILKNLEELGIELDPDSMKKVTQRVIELGDKKEYVTQDDLPYIISDVLRSSRVIEKIKIVNFSLSIANGLKSVATLAIKVNDKVYEETAAGDGQYDAFMIALKKIYAKLNKTVPRLSDYIVTIPPGGKTDALVETVITWEGEDDRNFKTRGLDPDQTVAAIKATMRMLNIIEK
ncbi:MAG: 2-isopropylmalate synthase [Bacteroidales bacterium]|nr:2-isopropylmalate synthase [Bacteroidales bacterium]